MVKAIERDSVFSETPIIRRKSRQIMVGNVPVGGDAPISVQSMTNTSTADVAATVEQIKRIQVAGADIVRVSVPSLEEAEAFGQIRKLVDVPLVADIHFTPNAAEVAADHVEKIRVNPKAISAYWAPRYSPFARICSMHGPPGFG